MLTGENGILTQANKAKEENEKAMALEKVQMEVGGSRGTDGKLDYALLEENLNNIKDIEGVPSTITEESFPLKVIVDKNKIKIEEDGTIKYFNPGKPDKNGLFTERSTINGEMTSSKNNPLIPVGFKPVDQEKAIWGNRISEPTEESVHAGLVIEDGEGNQYVWIAVDGVMQEVEGDGGKTLQNVIEGEIVLGRYVFKDDGTIDITENVTPTILGGEIKESTGATVYTESLTQLSGFINSVRANGGYYIARYEASYGADGKANSKISNGYINRSGASYAPDGDDQEGYLWNNIVKTDTIKACRDMYGENINSYLINSYAWDTAILFIQKYSGDVDYSRQNRLQSKLTNTGESKDESGNKDVRCNIYDMAGNCVELTTENTNYWSRPSNYRGGSYNSESSFASTRGITFSGGGSGDPVASNYISFRSLLYL